MTNLELQKHLLRLWLDEKPLPELEARRNHLSPWEYVNPVVYPYSVPCLNQWEYRIKPKEYKVDQPVWTRDCLRDIWIPRHYAGLVEGKHSVWTSGRTSHTAKDSNIRHLIVGEITDVDPNV